MCPRGLVVFPGLLFPFYSIVCPTSPLFIIMTKTNIYNLLESISQDHPTFNFPVHSISKQLTNMLVNQEEFDYFMMEAYRVIKNQYGFAYGHIFLTILESKIKVVNLDVLTLSYTEYQAMVTELIETLENVMVTRVEKDSPDGEMLTVMSEAN